MRNYCFLLFTVIGLFGCKNNVESVSVTGEIKGLGNDTVYLYGVDELADLTDTIYAKNDRFSYTIQVDAASQIILLFNNAQTYPVFFDKGDKITVKGDVERLHLLKVKGNSSNEKLTDFLEVLDSISPYENGIEEKVDSFIRVNFTLPVSVYLLDNYFVQKESPDYAKIKELIDVMTGDLQDKPYIEALKETADYMEKAALNKSVSSFNIPGIDGKKISRSSFTSKHILVSFWASWEDESKTANAELRKVNRMYKEIEKKRKAKKKKAKDEKEELSILSISLDTDRGIWKQVIKQDTLSWTQVCDTAGWNSEVVKQFAVHKIPANILINSYGKIIARDIAWDSLTVKLPELLNPPLIHR